MKMKIQRTKIYGVPLKQELRGDFEHEVPYIGKEGISQGPQFPL